MNLLQIIVLAIVQGFTEFLPVSSSAHLILVPILTGWQDQSLIFDIAMHVGTVMAVVCYFRHELVLMLRDWLGTWQGHPSSPNSRLAWMVILGTLPIGLVGLLVKPYVEHELRSPLVIACSTIFFGALLWFAFRYGSKQRHEDSMNWRDAALIAFSQALALIPGTSRSGVTITAGLASGLTPKAAARFSFLLSIPAISAAGLFSILDALGSGVQIAWADLMIGALLSGISGYICIHFFLSLLDRIGVLPFVIYRMVLGVGLFIFFL